jgi:cytoskeleton protein RodZ
MPTVAEQLRQGREQRKLDVYQVAEITKIKTDHIRALEEGNFNCFTAPVYIRGFVRTYGTLLKLDLPKLMADLDQELGRTEKFATPPSLTVQPKSVLDYLMLRLSLLNWKLAVLLVLVAAGVIGGGLAYRASQKQKNVDPLKNLGSGLYQPRQETGELLPLPTTAPRR